MIRKWTKINIVGGKGGGWWPAFDSLIMDGMMFHENTFEELDNPVILDLWQYTCDEDGNNSNEYSTVERMLESKKGAVFQEGTWGVAGDEWWYWKAW